MFRIGSREIGDKSPIPPQINPPQESNPNWGERHLVIGPFSTKRLTVADSCRFAEYRINAKNHEGFARVYGKASAERIVACLTACEGMEDPVTVIEILKLNQQRAE